jgi:hypothetical protein
VALFLQALASRPELALSLHEDSSYTFPTFFRPERKPNSKIVDSWIAEALADTFPSELLPVLARITAWIGRRGREATPREYSHDKQYHMVPKCRYTFLPMSEATEAALAGEILVPKISDLVWPTLNAALRARRPFVNAHAGSRSESVTWKNTSGFYLSHGEFAALHSVMDLVAKNWIIEVWERQGKVDRANTPRFSTSRGFSGIGGAGGLLIQSGSMQQRIEPGSDIRKFPTRHYLPLALAVLNDFHQATLANLAPAAEEPGESPSA